MTKTIIATPNAPAAVGPCYHPSCRDAAGRSGADRRRRVALKTALERGRLARIPADKTPTFHNTHHLSQ